MREIKFRAFSKKSKGMVFAEYATFLKDGSLVIYDNYELMQYTGLKDKNGVEIFEGDIVYDEWDNTVGKVIFSNGSFCFVKYTFIVSLAKRFHYDPALIPEVIGNIYENPELLGAQNGML